MKPIREIRRLSLLILVKEAGGQAALCRQIKMDPKQMSPLRKPQGEKNSRGIGDPLARRHIQVRRSNARGEKRAARAGFFVSA